MDDVTDVSGLVIEAARRGCTSDKADRLKGTAVAHFPYVPCISAAICTSLQSCNNVGWQTKFLGKRHEEIAGRSAIEISLPNVNNTEAKGVALSLPLGGVL